MRQMMQGRRTWASEYRQYSLSRALAVAGARGIGGWFSTPFFYYPGSADGDARIERTWHCGASTLEDAIAHPPPEGKHIAVSAMIDFNWSTLKVDYRAYGWYIEDGELVSRPIEAANTAAHNLTTIAALQNGATILGRLKALRASARGLAMRTCSWRDDVQSCLAQGVRPYVEVHTDLPAHNPGHECLVIPRYGVTPKRG